MLFAEADTVSASVLVEDARLLNVEATEDESLERADESVSSSTERVPSVLTVIPIADKSSDASETAFFNEESDEDEPASAPEVSSALYAET